MSSPQPSLATPTVTITYGTFELVIAEHTLTRNAAPFTATNPSDDLNKVEDAALLDAYKSQFLILAEHPKSIALQRAYATLIIFHRISKNPQLNLDYQQAKDRLMGPDTEDTLLFIVANLLRYDDAELLQYFQRPHILPSSLMECRQAFILGDGNVLALFQEARKESMERLTMKEFRALYLRLDPQAVREPKAAAATASSATTAATASSDGKSQDGKEQKASASADASSASPVAASSSSSSSSSSPSSSPSSSSSSSPSSPSSPVKLAHYSATPASARRKKRKAQSACLACKRNDRPEAILLCDRVGCQTECHYDCVEPPLSAVPEGSWFCAACKLVVKQALLEERSLAVRQESDSEKHKAEDDTVSEEMTVEEWREEQEQWRQDKEALQQALADRDAELARLRAEVEQYHQQQAAEQRGLLHPEQSDERKEEPAAEQHTPSKRRASPDDEPEASIADEEEEERKESPAVEEQKEAPPTSRRAQASARKMGNSLNKRGSRGRARS